MPRGPFAHSAKLTTGPNASTPNSVRGTYDVRMVAQGRISPVHPVLDRPYWMTIDAVMPTSGFTLAPLRYNIGKADRVSWPDLDVQTYEVWYVDELDYDDGSQYWRAALIPIQTYPDLPAGGTTCPTATNISPDTPYIFNQTATTRYYRLTGVPAGSSHVSGTITGGTIKFSSACFSSICTLSAGLINYAGYFSATCMSGDSVYRCDIVSGTPTGVLTWAAGL